MKVIIQKPDLDTCLTALIMGVTNADEITILRREASKDDLENSDILCIEAGGNGQTELLNFDHHDPGRYLPPACRQAYEFKKYSDHELLRLVEYVSMVDDRPVEHPVIPFPSLSNIFSGMLLVEKTSDKQFQKGLEILSKILKENINPFLALPDLVEWQGYKKAKEENNLNLEMVLKNASYFEAATGIKVGYAESGFIGGIGALYKQGCGVVIMYNESFGTPFVRKFTIAGNGINVGTLLTHFNKHELGWGGRETIIGSPREGTTLTCDQVLKEVIDHL